MEKTTMNEKQLESQEAAVFVEQILQHVKNPRKHHTPYVDFGESLNYVIEEVEERGKTKTYKVPLQYNYVVDRLIKMTQGQMARVENMVFASPAKRGGEIKPLNNTSEFFGRLGVVNKCVMDWSKAQGMMNPSEAFSEVKVRLPVYRGIETAPHYPLMPDYYYNYPKLPEPDFDALEEFIDMFCPASEQDKYLMLAMFLTALWGGTVGQRPAFIITSHDGQGSGKTTLGEMMAYLLNQIPISGSTKESMSDLITRLLSPAGMMSRIVLFDNEVGRVSNEDLAGLMTSRSISGKRLYTGEGNRPNTMLWVITLNTPTVDKDLASRGVVIYMKKPKYDKDWQSNISKLIENKRWGIISALITMLKTETSLKSGAIRWAAWENEVLVKTRMFYRNTATLQKTIIDRQHTVDDEIDELELIRDSFLSLLAYNKIDLRLERCFIKNTIVANIYKSATGAKCRKNTALRSMREIVRTKGISELSEFRHSVFGRGFVWCGDTVSEDSDMSIVEWYNKGEE